MNLFFWQLQAEIRKMLARKRTYLGFGAFILLEVVIFAMLHLDKVENGFRKMIQHQGESFEKYFSALTLGFIVLMLILLLSAVFMVLVAGDVVAKESEDGNLRLILSRPISRLRLLTIKYVACQIYTIVLMQFTVWSILLTGIILRGWGGGLIVFVPEEQMLVLFDANEGLVRYGYASLGLCASMMGATSIAFFLSCFRIKPAAATISALSYLFMDSVLRELHIMDSYKHFLITHYMTTWRMLFMETIPWVTVLRQYSTLAGVSLTLFVLGAMVFESRDVKS